MRHAPFCLALWLSLASLAPAGELAFKDIELPTKLTVGYAVRLLDMNSDKRLDICIVDSDRILWLENPNWKEHVLIEKQTKPDNVCFAPYDINGDGQIDFAVGAEWKPFTGGDLQWITGKSPVEKWDVHRIGEVHTNHRMNFGDLDGDGKQELVVAPLMGKGATAPNWDQAPVRIVAYKIPKDPVAGPWKEEVFSEELHVTHNFEIVDLDGDGQNEMILVSFEGVHLLERQQDGSWKRTRIGTGNQETAPNKGASEIKLGRVGGVPCIATIEPWHGTQVVIYTPPSEKRDPSAKEWLWKRTVLDEQLKWGHAVQWANLDSDEDTELIIGVRDDLDSSDPTKRRGLRIYDPVEGGKSWKRTIVDPGSVAIEDAAAGDLNGDGKVDIVAVGRQTHNVKIYFNETK